MQHSPPLPYYYGTESEQYTFYRIPKLLFTDARFSSISSDAKILYGSLIDRMALSVKNQWLDKYGRIYIIFSIEEAKELLNCGTEKSIKIFNELDVRKGVGLIERVRQGQGKPSIIYLKNFAKKL